MACPPRKHPAARQRTGGDDIANGFLDTVVLNQFAMHLTRVHRVFHQHGDGHGSYAARHRGDCRGHFRGLIKGYVTFKDPLAICGPTNLVDTHINNYRTGLDHVTLDVFGHTGGNDQDVGTLGMESNVFRSGVNNGDRGIGCGALLHKHGGNRLAHDIGTAEAMERKMKRMKGIRTG